MNLRHSNKSTIWKDVFIQDPELGHLRFKHLKMYCFIILIIAGMKCKFQMPSTEISIQKKAIAICINLSEPKVMVSDNVGLLMS
jgi:hypothetical protein